MYYKSVTRNSTRLRWGDVLRPKNGAAGVRSHILVKYLYESNRRK